VHKAKNSVFTWDPLSANSADGEEVKVDVVRAKLWETEPAFNQSSLLVYIRIADRCNSIASRAASKEKDPIIAIIYCRSRG
jgi:hypothetical protein